MTNLTDTGIVVVILVAGMLSTMRIFYGSWPWDLSKTWHATKRTVWAAEAMERARKKQFERQFEVEPPVEVTEPVNNVFELPPTDEVDHFDRSLIVEHKPPPTLPNQP